MTSGDGSDTTTTGAGAPGGGAGLGLLGVDDLVGLVDLLGAGVAAETDVELVDAVAVLERLKGAVAAAQAVLTHDLGQRRAAAAEAQDLLDSFADVPATRRARVRARAYASTGQEIGLARRESPHRGRVHRDLAHALLTRLPATHAALAAGWLSEERALVVATETRDLDHASAREIDALLGDHLKVRDGTGAGVGTEELREEVRRLVVALDPAGVSLRRARAVARRHLTSRVHGDGTASLTVQMPGERLPAVLGSLAQAADSAATAAARSEGHAEPDTRTRGQRLADAATDRLAGCTTDAQPVAVAVVVSSDVLTGDLTGDLDADHGPTGDAGAAGADPGAAFVPGAGWITPAQARDLVRRALRGGEEQHGTASTWQRLFATPTTGALVAAERTTRLFPADLQTLLRLRDRRCRTPYCDAPVRHADHIEAHADGGPTSLTNGDGLCESCNHVKQHPGWRHHTSRDPDPSDHSGHSPDQHEYGLHRIDTTTPTGHHHTTHEPGLPRPPRPPGTPSRTPRPRPRPPGPPRPLRCPPHRRGLDSPHLRVTRTTWDQLARS